MGCSWPWGQQCELWMLQKEKGNNAAGKLIDGGGNTNSQILKESSWITSGANLCSLNKPTWDSFLCGTTPLCGTEEMGAAACGRAAVGMPGDTQHGKMWLSTLQQRRPGDWACWQAGPGTCLLLRDCCCNYCHHCLHQGLQPHEFGASSLLVSALKLAVFYTRPVVSLTYFWTIKSYFYI